MSITYKKIIFVGAGPASYAAIRALRDSGFAGKILIYTSPIDESYRNYQPFKSSPKIRQKEFLSASSINYKFLNIKKSNFTYVPTGGIGGGTNFWGASIAEFDNQQLKKNNLSYSNYKKNISKAYSFVTKPNLKSRSILTSNRIKNLFIKTIGIEIKSPEVAVNENLCTKCGNCFSPCKTKAIWSLGKKDFDKLNVVIKYEVIGSIKKSSSFYYLYDSKKKLIDSSSILVLGGNVATNFKLLCNFSKTKKSKIYSTPSYSFLFFSKGKLDEKIFGMGNSTFRIYNNRQLVSFGNLYDGKSLDVNNRNIFSNSSFVDYFAKKISKYFIFGAGFLSSDEIHTTIAKKNDFIFFESKLQKSYFKNMEHIKESISNNIKNRFGPIFFIKGSNGADIHYAGGIPSDLQHENESGKIKGLIGLYVIGGSNFTFLPPISPTLSFIANAYGVGKIISNEFN